MAHLLLALPPHHRLLHLQLAFHLQYHTHRAHVAQPQMQKAALIRLHTIVLLCFVLPLVLPLPLPLLPI